MKTNSRLYLLLAGASLAPVLVFAAAAAYGPGGPYDVFFAIAAALLAAFFAARLVAGGLISPMARMAAGVKSFVKADYRLDSAMPKEGWPEAGNLISALNRVMLELSAYRAFHLNQLVDERTKAQALIDTIADGILLTDDRGQLIYSNQLALKLLGIPKQEANITLPGSVRQLEFGPAIKEIMASQENYLKAEVEVRVPGDPSLSGRWETGAPPAAKSFRVISRQFFLATLKRPGRVIGIRDVTVEKEIESARETFFHMITHDMRAPLTSIQGYAQLMRNSVPQTPQTEKCLQTILRSSIRLNGMIEDILTTMKLENGEMTLHPVAADAVELCSRVFEIHEPLAARKEIKFSAVLPRTKIAFSADTGLLERVITNLLGNSLKFTPEGRTVELSCGEAAGEVVFSVRDTGPGIPKEKQAEIFEKYAQQEEHKYMGFGLGLAMCKLAVELHKGRIWVESEEGKGSKFSFAIPGPKAPVPPPGATELAN